MRCPKCQYISFEGGGRCRNCGYDFALAPSPETIDLPIRTGDEPMGPLADLELADAPDLSSLPPLPPRPGSRRTPASEDFPLFREVDDDSRTSGATAAPRRGSVPRRPVGPRGPEAEDPRLELEPDTSVEPQDEPRMRRAATAISAHAADAAPAPAPTPSRLLGAGIDLLLLAGIDAGVLYLTLQFTGVGLHEISILPLIPFGAFLAILNGGYLIILTVAGGQTIGKMAAGIKVINADDEAPSDGVPFAQAVIRAVAILVSVLPAGLGFIPALVSADRRALHDRIANTRVVRA